MEEWVQAEESDTDDDVTESGDGDDPMDAEVRPPSKKRRD